MWCKSAIILLTFVVGLDAHGRLMDPPARNSMWRLGFPNPVNYNDNELFCGGYGVQYGPENNGKCGPCGDDYRQKEPREHESQGLYGNGIIGRRYVAGQRITVEIELTTNHMGYFTMNLCPINDKSKPSTDDCFNKFPLLTADELSTRYYIPPDTPKVAILKYDILLPPGLTCQHCVIQWTYHTGNTWGICPNRTQAIGCGPQETFRNCADVTILSNTGTGYPSLGKKSKDEIDFPHAIFLKDGNKVKRPFVVRSQVCLPTPEFENQPYAGEWCKINCLRYPPNCPKSKCYCISDCRATGELANQEGTDVFCLRNCLKFPHENCPKDQCECFGGSPDKDHELVKKIFSFTEDDQITTEDFTESIDGNFTTEDFTESTDRNFTTENYYETTVF